MLFSAAYAKESALHKVENSKPLFSCVEKIKAELPQSTLKSLEAANASNLTKFHMSLGSGMRNEYIYDHHGDSPLVKFFLANGIKQPDDMSAIIISCLWSELHNKPFELEKELEDYRLTERSTDPIIDLPTKLLKKAFNIPIKDPRTGQSKDLASYKGRVVIVSALTPGCSDEIQQLNKLRKEFPESQVEIIGMLLPSSQDEASGERVQFANAQYHSFLLLPDEPRGFLRELSRSYHQYGMKIPETWVISKSGTGVLLLNGRDVNIYSELHKRLPKLIE
jgi:peroxiredoxin